MTSLEPGWLYGTPLSLAVGLATAALLVPLVGRLFIRLGIAGVDIHKPHRPRIPEAGGLGIIAAIAMSQAPYYFLEPKGWPWALGFVLSAAVAGAVGLLDDLKPLRPTVKPILTALAAAPILALSLYDPHLRLPFMGRARLTIVYPFVLVPAGIAVASNAVNMLDVLNGSMASSAAIVSAGFIALLAISGKPHLMPLAAGLLGGLLGFYLYNRYPAKIFAGDTGSLSVGAAIGSLAIIGSVEFTAVIFMIPYIMNSFHSLASVGRLFEKREVADRPITVQGDGLLSASARRGAPITLVRLILAEGPLDEPTVVKAIAILTALSTALGILTEVLMVWGLA